MKKFFAVIVGIIIAGIIITTTTVASLKFFSNQEALAAFEFGSTGNALKSIWDDSHSSTEFIRSTNQIVTQLSAIGLILVILGHAIGALAGGATIGRILKDDTMNVGMTLGAILTGLGMINMVMFNYPEWYYLDLLAYLPGAMFGANYTSRL